MFWFKYAKRVLSITWWPSVHYSRWAPSFGVVSLCIRVKTETTVFTETFFLLKLTLFPLPTSLLFNFVPRLSLNPPKLWNFSHKIVNPFIISYFKKESMSFKLIVSSKPAWKKCNNQCWNNLDTLSISSSSIPSKSISSDSLTNSAPVKKIFNQLKHHFTIWKDKITNALQVRRHLDRNINLVRTNFKTVSVSSFRKFAVLMRE